MKALFDLTHPAHVHVFRPTIEALRAAGELSLDWPAVSARGDFQLQNAGWTAASFERVVEGLEGHGEVVLERGGDGSTTLRTSFLRRAPGGASGAGCEVASGSGLELGVGGLKASGW